MGHFVCALMSVRVCIYVHGGARPHGLAVFYSACVSSMLVMLLETQLCWNNSQDPLQRYQPPSGHTAGVCVCVHVCAYAFVLSSSQRETLVQAGALI